MVFDRWKWLSRHLEPGPLRTLDAGCGSGAFTLYAAKIGNQAVGLSFDERNNEAARERAELLGIENVRFLECDLRKLDAFQNIGTFDQIICFETIEHIMNDRKLVADLSQRLRPGGRLLLTTPFAHYKTPFRDPISEIEDGGHVRRGYTHDEIKKLFAEADLEVEKAEYVSGLVSQILTYPIWHLNGIAQRLFWMATFPLRIFQPLDEPLTRFLRHPTFSIGVVGVKRV